MMLERKLMSSLIDWKNDADRMPLILHGGRQTGKTYLVKEFVAQNYDDLAYFDFEANPEVAALFEGDITPKSLLPELELRLRRKIVPGKTLIFLDEVQKQGRALTALKYFNEQAPEQHVIAAGSLLGIAIAREQVSYPVGNVNHRTLDPLDFEEFLWALGEKMLADAIRENFQTLEAFSMHDTALKLYRTYLICGGMPAAVNAYLKARDLAAPLMIHKNIEKDHAFDIVKYADKSESVLILEALQSIPRQLAKDNHKFQYSAIAKGARSSTYRNPLMWLEAARICSRCVNVNEGFTPLKASADDKTFKLYMADTGMLCTAFGADPLAIYADDITSSVFRGALAENFVMQQLIAQGIVPYYWGIASKAEVDFVFTDQEYNAVPVEVKYSDNVRSRSLEVFRQKYRPAYSIRLSQKNFGEANGIRSIPLYAAFCLRSPDSLSYSAVVL